MHSWLHEFSGSLSRPSAGQRSEDFSQGVISFCQGLFSTPAFASPGLALEITSLQHQDLGTENLKEDFILTELVREGVSAAQLWKERGV